jgi:hypothetical protein
MESDCLFATCSLIVVRCSECGGTVAGETIVDGIENDTDAALMVIRHLLAGRPIAIEDGPQYFPTCNCLEKASTP